MGLRADAFRVALLSYADNKRLYASSKSRWNDFHEGLQLVMDNCVSRGTGGAYLVPRKLARFHGPSIHRHKIL